TSGYLCVWETGATDKPAVVWESKLTPGDRVPAVVPGDKLVSAAWHPDGQRISLAYRGAILFWYLDGTTSPHGNRRRDEIASAAWRPTGDSLLQSYAGGKAEISGWSGGGEDLTIERTAGFAAWSPDGTRVLTGSQDDHGARIYIVDTGLLRTSLENVVYPSHR
ncbi:MAG TPA: WD40 repeat domain-containing protein, partial [Polyangium sp.]|nr:WD40 repeat domain-containing protein [Polyangium sp.]